MSGNSEGTGRERETALRELLTLIAEVAVVPLPAVPKPFDCERHLTDRRAYEARLQAFAIHVWGAASYAAGGDLQNILVAIEVLRHQTSVALPYEPYPEPEAAR